MDIKAEALRLRTPGAVMLEVVVGTRRHSSCDSNHAFTSIKAASTRSPSRPSGSGGSHQGVLAIRGSMCWSRTCWTSESSDPLGGVL